MPVDREWRAWDTRICMVYTCWMLLFFLNMWFIYHIGFLFWRNHRWDLLFGWKWFLFLMLVLCSERCDLTFSGWIKRVLDRLRIRLIFHLRVFVFCVEGGVYLSCIGVLLILVLFAWASARIFSKRFSWNRRNLFFIFVFLKILIILSEVPKSRGLLSLLTEWSKLFLFRIRLILILLGLIVIILRSKCWCWMSHIS